MNKQIKIAVASGKGGTGKTTFAVNLFSSISDEYSSILVDCDVEEPNAILFQKWIEKSSEDVKTKTPVLKTSKCEYCGRCVNFCAFNAIIYLKDISYIGIMEDLCHGCGGCVLACKKNALEEKEKRIGKVNTYILENKKKIIEGELDVGVATPVPVIKAVKKNLQANVIIYDAPPGTSCPAVEAVSDADYIILVAEPTPFGLNDLKLSVEAFASMKKKIGVVINKAGIGNYEIYEYLQEINLEILAEIPFNKDLAEEISKGNLLIDAFPKLDTIFNRVFEQIKQIS